MDKDSTENKVSIIVALMQKNSREKRLGNYGDAAEEFIQFRLFKVIKNKFLLNKIQTHFLKSFVGVIFQSPSDQVFNFIKTDLENSEPQLQIAGARARRVIRKRGLPKFNLILGIPKFIFELF